MKLFITGISGLLGLNAALQTKEQFEVSGCYYSHPIHVEGIRALRIDVSSYDQLRDALDPIRPDLILHAAGLTNVDKCEEDRELAYQLNVSTSENIARIASFMGSTLVHISTDHLFDGTQAFVEEETPPSPLNVYARTKWQAEQVVQHYSPKALIIRTNFYGWGSSIKKSLSDWILDGLKGHKELPTFSDVYFTPILVNDLIDLVLTLSDLGAGGVYNVAGRDRVSKQFFAGQLAEVFHYSPNGIRSISVDQVGLKARRPRDMSLNCEKASRLIGREMPGIGHGLRRLKSLYEQGWNSVMARAVENGSAMQVFPSAKGGRA